jgi:hypothetical protein
MNLVTYQRIKNTTFEELAYNINSISLIPYAFVDVEDASVHYNNKDNGGTKEQKELSPVIN